MEKDSTNQKEADKGSVTTADGRGECMASQLMTFQKIADEMGFDKKTAANICRRALAKIAANEEAMSTFRGLLREKYAPEVSVRNAVKSARREQ